MKRFERGKNSGLGSVREKCCDGVTQILASLFSIFRLICVGPARLLLLLHTLTTRSPSTAAANKHPSSPCHTTSSYSLSSLWWNLPLQSPFFIYQFPTRRLFRRPRSLSSSSWCSPIPSSGILHTYTISIAHFQPIVSISAVLALPPFPPTSSLLAVSGC